VDGSWAKIANIRRPRVAIALGGGGARGIAHVLALEALDEMGISPVAIAGTSMGAIVGGAYAAGIEGAPFGLIYYESCAIAPTS
jgi:predicted acylesterase/phospholipase RssA